MNLPINFPNDAEVIAEEAARFRALSPAARIEAIRGVLEAGALMIERSPNAEFVRRHAEEQEKLFEMKYKEFIARHAR
jgi:hypothetical protein